MIGQPLVKDCDQRPGEEPGGRVTEEGESCRFGRGTHVGGGPFSLHFSCNSFKTESKCCGDFLFLGNIDLLKKDPNLCLCRSVFS